jgi:hypothetical protein
MNSFLFRMSDRSTFGPNLGLMERVLRREILRFVSELGKGRAVPYTMADFENLRANLLGPNGLWHMLRKDLLQQLEMPAHFDQAVRPELGCAPNLSVMMIAMAGLETMATMAKIGGRVPGDDATETVKRFADRYLTQVNPLYARPPGQSLIRLLWDAYRNGGIHRFFPKAGTVQVGGRPVDVTFSISWERCPSPAGSGAPR